MSDAKEAPFWRRKRLEELSPAEWESLCDGCGRCCLVKLEEDLDDGEPGPIHYTDIACRLFEEGSCRCADYPNRQAKVSDCVRLTPEAVRSLRWLPPTCGYRLVGERRDLPWWHPLVSGDPETVHLAGVSVRGRISAMEDDIADENTVDFIVEWPRRWPRGAKGSSPPQAATGDSRSAHLARMDKAAKTS